MKRRIFVGKNIRIEVDNGVYYVFVTNKEREQLLQTVVYHEEIEDLVKDIVKGGFEEV